MRYTVRPVQYGGILPAVSGSDPALQRQAKRCGDFATGGRQAAAAACVECTLLTNAISTTDGQRAARDNDKAHTFNAARNG